MERETLPPEELVLVCAVDGRHILTQAQLFFALHALHMPQKIVRVVRISASWTFLYWQRFPAARLQKHLLPELEEERLMEACFEKAEIDKVHRRDLKILMGDNSKVGKDNTGKEL
ncbi:hypothetical protein DNTS_029273, partial [Danionella cerebrum]